MENPKKYPAFDFNPLKNTQIAILRAVFNDVLEKMASIFQKFSRRPLKIPKSEFYTLKNTTNIPITLLWKSPPPRQKALSYVSRKADKPLNREQWRKFNRATNCHICLKVQMKFFIAEFERAAKIRKIAVYRFLISLLVPEL